MSQFSFYQSAESCLNEIRNVFCVGRNYRDHATELGNAVPAEPMIFAKSTHALCPAKGQVVLPPDRTDVHHELEIILFITEAMTAESTAKEVVGAVALGLDLTDRTAQTRLKAAGHPWEFAKSFVHSAVLTDVYAFTDFASVERARFTLDINDRQVQWGDPADMVFSFDALISYVHKHFGLNQGDILFTGTPAGVGPLQSGDVCTLSMNGATWGTFEVK